VLALDEVTNHPHHIARGSFIELDGIVQPAPAPRFSRSEVGVSHGSRIPGEDTLTVLQEAGLGEAEINELVESGAVVNAAGA
jgi:alpha-methylacyl-CoA racemase